jgi:hypothetical protein
MKRRRRDVRATIDWDMSGQPVVTTDAESFAALVAALDSELHSVKHRRKGAAESNKQKTDRMKDRDSMIRAAADADTGDPRTLAARLAKRRWPTLTGEKDSDGKPITESLTAKTIRNALCRTAPKEKRKLA